MEQKVKIVTLWFETKSYVQVHWRNCQYYNIHTHNGPSNGNIQQFVEHFQALGSVKNQNNNSGHRRRSRELANSASSVWRILTSELKLYPYIISVRHKLTLNDMASQVTMCGWFSDRMERYPNWNNSLWFSDEAYFHLNGAFNNHNNIFLGAEHPEDVCNVSQGPQVHLLLCIECQMGYAGTVLVWRRHW